LRWGFAGFLEAASLPAFLPAIGISISFWPLATLRGFLAGFESFALGRHL
jgi:hypothetical protein